MYQAERAIVEGSERGGGRGGLALCDKSSPSDLGCRWNELFTCPLLPERIGLARHSWRLPTALPTALPRDGAAGFYRYPARSLAICTLAFSASVVTFPIATKP